MARLRPRRGIWRPPGGWEGSRIRAKKEEMERAVREEQERKERIKGERERQAREEIRIREQARQ